MRLALNPATLPNTYSGRKNTDPLTNTISNYANRPNNIHDV